LQRLAPGVFAKPNVPTSIHYELTAVSCRRPELVICLMSALAFHGLTEQLPHAVHVGIEARQRLPQWEWPKIAVVHLAPSRFPNGIEVRELDGIQVRITSPARTLADGWKFPHLVDRTTLLQATKTALQERICSLQDIVVHLDAYGLTDRALPYLECLTL
jgi:predicted transcriptional regulator of viral defense system